MYLLFDKKNGIFQFGLRALNELTLQHGVWFPQLDLIADFSKTPFLFQTDFICIQFHSLTCKKNSSFIYDMRLRIKNKFFEKIILVILYTIRFLVLKKIKLSMIIIGLVIFFSSFSLMAGFTFFSLKTDRIQNEAPWEGESFLQVIKHSNLAHSIAIQKYDYMHEKIPSYHGIQKYKFIPLKSDDSSEAPFQGYIALPYSQIVVLNSKHEVLQILPKESCTSSRKFYFYSVHEQDEILFLDSQFMKGDEDFFYIFSKLSMKKNICEESISHQVTQTEEEKF